LAEDQTKANKTEFGRRSVAVQVLGMPGAQQYRVRVLPAKFVVVWFLAKLVNQEVWRLEAGFGKFGHFSLNL
jgi:hypothetical protein